MIVYAALDCPRTSRDLRSSSFTLDPTSPRNERERSGIHRAHWRGSAGLRLARDGYNELPSAKPRGLWAIAWEVVREPMFLLLIGASAIYLVLGDIREALVLFASVFVVMGITFYQERKTERALEALRELASPRAQVLRDGEWQSVPGREVVRRRPRARSRKAIACPPTRSCSMPTT